MMEVPTVYLVEDNQAVRDSLVWMLQRAGMQVEAHSSPAEILEACEPSKLGCLILDLQLPEMTGLELRNRLVEKGCDQPFLIITGHGEIPDATAAMRMGAVDFLEKPLNREHLIERVWHAIDTD